MANDQDVVIVTGGAYGIGRAVAAHFCEKGAAVAIGDLNSEKGLALQLVLQQAGHQAFFLHTDVRNDESVRNLILETIKKWGRLTVLCNNAGIERYHPLEEYSSQDWDDIINTNLRGAFLCSKFALPYLKQAKGCIVNIGSVQALACEQNISIYAASKAGILAFTRALAIDNASAGVRVNAV
ncbi:MAG: SDR family NAD(P)-dependent oxidoreductase, partial [Candidatus Micrarchaeaceae archaeon]